MKKLVCESLNERIDFNRGGNPMDSMNIGNRLARIEAMGEKIPLIRYLFDDLLEEVEDPEELEIYKRAKANFLKHIKYPALVEYVKEEENLEEWGDMDEYGTMGDVLDEFENAGEDEFYQWASDMLEFFGDAMDIPIEKYQIMLDEIYYL